MIEFEEVKMVELCDEVLELIQVKSAYTVSGCSVTDVSC
jgi:hypothetical protein